MRQVNDWQTRCTCSLEGSTAGLELVQLIPTAGCDPDAPASTRAWQHDLHSGSPELVVSTLDAASGYVLASTSEQQSAPWLEAALPLAKQGERLRMRVFVSPERQLDRVELHYERKYADYESGRRPPELDAQPTTVSGRPKLEAEQLAGTWRLQSGADASSSAAPETLRCGRDAAAPVQMSGCSPHMTAKCCTWTAACWTV